MEESIFEAFAIMASVSVEDATARIHRMDTYEVLRQRLNVPIELFVPFAMDLIEEEILSSLIFQSPKFESNRSRVVEEVVAMVRRSSSSWRKKSESFRLQFVERPTSHIRRNGQITGEVSQLSLRLITLFHCRSSHCNATASSTRLWHVPNG